MSFSKKQSNDFTSDSTDDFVIYHDNKGNIPNLTAIVHKKYNPLIQKSARKYHNMNARIDMEDFCSDVYIQLHKYMEYINPDKIKSNTFSFCLYVKYAIQKVAYKEYKIASKIKCSIHDENFQEPEYIENTYKDIDYGMDIEKFKSTLSSRQKKILSLRRKGLDLHEIKDKLNVSYGTVHRDIWLAKKSFKDVFGIEANKYTDPSKYNMNGF